MDSGLIPGIIGGIISVFLCQYFAKKAKQQAYDGQLKYGLFIVVLFWMCLAVTLGCTYALFFTEIDYSKDLMPILALITMFGFFSIYAWGEAYKISGHFDEFSIEFHTPWTGTKIENWNNLQRIKFNAAANWYVLTFKNGTIIRLSTYLIGHGMIIDLLKAKGHEVQNEPKANL